MDHKAINKQYQRSNSEEIEVNAELFYVIRKRNISTQEKLQEVQKLLGKNPQPDINAQDGNDNGNTPLHLAIKRNEMKVVNFLLTQGADTAIENGDGKTPLNLAEERNFAEIIEALKSFTSQVEWRPSDTVSLASHASQPVEANHNEVPVFHSNSNVAASGKQTASTVLPPFSGELSLDKKLKFSHKDFKQLITEFHNNKQLSNIDQLKATPPYPTPHVLAQFANMAYKDCKHGEPNPPEGWLLLTTASHFGIKNGYFGTAYWHPEHQQVVIAHRGTDIKNVGAVATDFEGVLFNNFVEQMRSASTFANKVVSVLQAIQQEKKVSFELFFTGHSLGGWLAQVTTFTTEYLEVKGGKFLKRLPRQEQEPFTSSTVRDSHDVRQSLHPHTVVFDSPGCKDMLSQMADKLDVRLHGHSIDLQHLDITSYLSAPNRINTCNSHLGTVYRIFTDLSDMGWKEKNTLLYNLATHYMDKIEKVFDPDTGQVCKDDEGRLKIREVVDWPISAGITGGAELKYFFKWAEYLNNYHFEVMDNVPSKVPKGYHPLRYQTKAYDECTKSLSAFTQDEREFLERYRWLRHVPEFFKPEELFSAMKNTEVTKEAEQKLRNFEVGSESVCCPDASKLHALIPYVKRLVQLFPQIKGNINAKLSSPQIRNRVYQHETQRYVENIEQNGIDFKPEALGLKEFLTSDKQIWHLRMVDGDSWTGITKVYRVLQNASCMHNPFRDGHYTILKLKRLLTVNRMINLNALLASTETPHLLMIACENNQPFNDELRDIFEELFSILKQKKTLKIILTTQPEDNTAASLQQIARTALGEQFITRDEHLTWSDLTASSQREILKKTVSFQGRRVALNQLTSAESMRDSFPLADLLQEKEFRIGEGHVPPACSGYNEKYYIDRSFNHNIVIKQDISRKQRGENFEDLLVSNEQVFKHLCQQNPNKNVHWLQKEKSGEFIWRQSQGNLKILRDNIVTHISHSYAPSDLDNLLQEATHQRVMLIADKAGMGKSTVLTHLSKQIKQKFPAHWLVRIDLNDYTEQLKAQKGKKMDKGRVLEFLSKEVLKLESHLENELFKKSFEGNEISKVVIMVDGFDEISPSYKETVIDMLQVLKQTSLEQLWVSTRTHVRGELEDNLQQLSYTLQPFSDVEQVEFLKKFWLQNSNLEHKDEHRLQVYPTALIRKLAQSISDKDREFTGIPLQTRMLAEAFEEDFRSFYVSKKSEPELPHKLDLLGLYGRFIDRKYDIFFKDKSKFQPGNTGAEGIRERDLKNIQVEHQLLALEALFTEEHYTFLQIQPDSAFSDEDLARIGIAHRNNEGKPHFIHRTFAEYYVADYLIKQLTKKNKQHEQVKGILLNEVLLRKEFHVIRAFMDVLLENSKPSKEALKEYGENIDEQLNKRKVETTALNEAAREDSSRIIGFLLDSLQSRQDSNHINMMMLNEGGSLRTAWHTATENGSLQALGKIWEWAEIVAPTQTYGLLLSQDMYGRTALQQAIEKDNIELAEKLWFCAKSKMTPADIKHALFLRQAWDVNNTLQFLVTWGRVKMLDKMWDWAKELQIKPEELRNEIFLSKNKHGQTVWHITAERGDIEVLEKLWLWVKELELKPEEIREMLFLSKDDSGQTIWHITVERGKVKVQDKLLEWAVELQVNPEELRNDAYDRHELSEKECNSDKQLQTNPEDEVLLSKDMYGKTAWHKTAESGNDVFLEKLWDFTKKVESNPEEIRKGLLLSKDNYGQTIWHIAAGRGKVKVLQKLWDWAKELQLNSEELRKYVCLFKDNSGQTLLHKAAGSDNVEVLEKMWDWVIELQLTSKEIRNYMCLLKDNSGQTPCHKAAAIGNSDVIEKLWYWAKYLQLNPQEVWNDMCLLKDRYGQTPWHMAVRVGNVQVIKFLCDWAKNLKLNPEELRNDVCLLRDNSGQTSWHKAAESGNVAVLKILWDWAKELQIKPEEIRNGVILLKDNSGQTPWHKAARSGYVGVLEKVWEWAKKLQLNPEELRNDVLLSKDNSGQTAWHKAAGSGYVGVLEKVWEWAKELQLNPEELKNDVYLLKDKSGKTAWHIAAGSGNVEVLEILWNWAKELQTNPEELRKRVCLSKDTSGQTPWHKAALSGKVEVLEKLWDWAKRLPLKPEELRNEVCFLKDNFRQTAWHMTAVSGNVEVLEKLWEWAKELQMKPEELRDELLSKDKSGQTVWHIAASRGYVELLDKMWDCAKKLQLRTEESRDELFSKDKSGQTAWHIAASRGYVELLDKMWDCAKELQLKPEEIINEALLSKDKSGQTAWLMATRSGRVKLLEKLWQWAKKLQLNPEELRNDVLLSRDKYGRTAWHIAASNGYVELLEKMWEFAKELQLRTVELRDGVFFSKDKFGQSTWLMAARSGKVMLLKKLWEWTKVLQLTPEGLRSEVMLSKNRYGQTAWHIAASRGYVELLQKMWDCAKELQLRTEELKNEVLLSKENSGQTAWLMAAKSGNVKLLDKLWDWAKILQLKPEGLREEVLMSKDKSGQTAFLMAARSGNVKLLKKLWDWVKGLQLNPEELRNEVWLSKDNFGQTAWHRAAERGHVKLLEKLWDWAKEEQIKPVELMKDVCLLKDNSGQTPWHKAAQRGKVEVLEKLWDWAKKLQLKPEEVKDGVLFLKDTSGKTAWHMAAGRGNVDILEKLWDWAKELQLKTEELKDNVCLLKDRYGHTVWHIAAFSGKVEVLEKLWDWAKELQLNPQELGIMCV